MIDSDVPHIEDLDAWLEQQQQDAASTGQFNEPTAIDQDTLAIWRLIHDSQGWL